MDMLSLNTAFGSIWSGSSLIYFIATVAISLLIWQRCPDARVKLKNTLLFLGLGAAGLILTDIFRSADPTGTAPIYHAALILLIGAALIRLLGLFIFRIVLDTLKIHPPSILEEILVVVAYFVWAMLQLHSAGVPLGEIITTSAIATAVLAFAMQDTLGNILGGLALQWDHSLKVGDWIQVGDVEGKIVDVKWRAISLETRNWETVVIPNGMMMKNQFKVLGERTGESVKWRRWIWFNVNYSVAPDRIIALAESAVLLAEIPGIALQPTPNCLLMDIDNSTARYALRYWLTDLAKDDPTDSQVRQHIYAALNRQDIRLAMPRQHFYVTNRDESYLEHKREARFEQRLEALGHIDLFSTLNQSEQQQLARSLEYRPYAQGDFIFRQGELDHFLYIINSGRADVFVSDDEGNDAYAFSLEQGEIFGEIGLLTGEPRGATVKASSALECYVLGKEDISDLLANRPEIVDEMSQVMVSRQSALQKARAEMVHMEEQHTAQHGVHELAARVKHFLGISG